MTNKINIGIYDEHKLVQEGISALLDDTEDMEVVLKESVRTKLNHSLKSKQIHILIINLHTLSTQLLNLIIHTNISYPEVKILIISVHNDEKIILKTIKAGAKGFLAKDTNRNELIQAIYTLRNGHDYYSKSITHLLLNKYISTLKEEDESNSSAKIKNLSSRELEIVKLWGNSYTNKEISEKLFISVRTVESHKNHIMQKLNLKTAVDLVKFAIKNNIIEI